MTSHNSNHHSDHSHSHGHKPVHDHNPPHFHDEPEARDMSKQRKTLLFSFILITVFMLVEAAGGVLTNSLALLSDAGHMLSDAVALGATLLAFKIGEKEANNQKTYGYKRFEILVAAANGATLIIISLMIVWEAIGRFSSPPDIASKGMLIIATIGLTVNLIVPICWNVVVLLTVMTMKILNQVSRTLTCTVLIYMCWATYWVP